MLRSIIGYVCYAFSVGLLVGAAWLNDGAFGAGFLFLIMASVFLLLGVLLLHSDKVRP